MNKINEEEAKKIAKDIFEKLEDQSMRDFLLVHSEKVGLMADFLAKKVGVESDVFRVAAWLHDIGNIVDNDMHAKHSIEVLRERKIDVDEILEDCILNHGNKDSAKTMEGRIFQVADKLSVFDIDTIEVFIKHGGLPMSDDYINFLKILSERSFELLENFKK